MDPVEGEGLPTVVRVVVEGNRRYAADRLRNTLGQRVGDPFDDKAINLGIERLWELFRVRATTSYRAVAGGLELRLQVVEIPVDLEPRFLGNDDYSARELLEWAGLDEDSEVFFSDAPRIARTIREEYLRRGYFFVEIDVVTREPRTDDGAEVAADLIFEVREGPHVAVEKVRVSGAASMPEKGMLFWKDGLRHLADTELGKPILGIFADDFVEETLDADLQAMREVYRRRGYLDAVVELDELEFSADREWVTIHIRVDEGPRYRVSSLRLEGIELATNADGQVYLETAELLFPVEELMAECDLVVGQPFERIAVEADDRALRSYYGERGYIDHRSIPRAERFQFLEPELVFHATEPKVDVIYRLVQGRRQFIREVVFSGGFHTQDRVMRRLVTVFPGEQADLGEIKRSLVRIHRTGYFTDRFNPGLHAEPTFRFLETGDSGWKDLLFEVEEGSALSFAFGGGVSTNSGLFGHVDLSIRNFDITSWPRSPWSVFDDIGDKEAFHGGGQELRIFAQPGTEVALFQVRFHDPDIFRLHFDRIGFTVDAQKRIRRFRSHDEERDELGVRFSRQLGIDGAVFVGYRFAEVFVDDLAVGGEPILTNPLTVPTSLKDQEGQSDVSYMEVGWVYDTFDHPLTPATGKDLSFITRVYDTSLGSDFEFLRSEFSGEYLMPFGDPELDVRPGMSYGLRFGAMETYGDTDEVPYTERFFLGGRTLRGFELHGVGPNENGFTRGGQSYVYGSLEYRFPLLTTTDAGTYRRRESVRGFLFTDAGVLGGRGFDLDFDEARVSAGFGIGLSVGLPLVLTFGWPLVEFEGDRGQRFSFSLGF